MSVCVLGVAGNLTYKVQPPTLSSADSFASTSSSTPLMFRPQVMATDHSSGYLAVGADHSSEFELAAVARTMPIDAGGVRRSPLAVSQPAGGRGTKRRGRGQAALPSVERNSDGAVYLPSSERRQRPPRMRRAKHAAVGGGGRKSPLPPVVRNSDGDVVVCGPRPPMTVTGEPPDLPDSELTPSTVIMQQIDDIYGWRRSSRRVPQYFGDGRPLPRPPTVDERDQLANEEDSVQRRSPL